MRDQEDTYRLLYVSDQIQDVPCDVGMIAEESRIRNARLGVTGALWFDGQHFLQLLEGSKEAINSVLHRVLNASQHKEIDIICFQKVPGRIYSDWAMSYFGSHSHNREVAEQFAGGPDLCLRSLPSSVLVEMLRFLEEERQTDLRRCVG